MQGICQLVTFYANKTEQRASAESFFAEGENEYELNPRVSSCIFSFVAKRMIYKY